MCGSSLGFLVWRKTCSWGTVFSRWNSDRKNNLRWESRNRIECFSQVFFAVNIAVFSLGQAAPQLQLLAQARGAAFELWKIIDTVRERVTLNETVVELLFAAVSDFRWKFHWYSEERVHRSYSIHQRSIRLSNSTQCTYSQRSLLHGRVWSNHSTGW